MGKNNKLYKSDDGGMSFYELHSFSNSSYKIIWIEQSRANTNVIYAQQFQEQECDLENNRWWHKLVNDYLADHHSEIFRVFAQRNKCR
jgi:hypothetical protein